MKFSKRVFVLLLFVGLLAQFSNAQHKVNRIVHIDSLKKVGKEKKSFILFNNAFGINDIVDINVGPVNKTLVFSNCNFANDFELSGVIHKSRFEMRSCNFLGAADFSYSHFADSLVWDRVTFLKNPKFTNSILPVRMALERVEFNGNELVDFSSCQLGKNGAKCILALDNSLVFKMILPFDLFQFERPIGEYDESEAVSIYQSLIRNCKEGHLLESVERWDIEYQQYTNKKRLGIVFGPILNWLQEKWWNFGYDRDRVFWKWLPTWFLIFFAINYVFLKRLLGIYNDTEIGKSFAEGKMTTAEIVKRHRFIYALIYTATIYFNFRLSVSAMNFKSHLGMMYIFFVYLVGTLHVVIGIAGYISMASHA